MSEYKYDNDKTVCACDKFQFLLDDYESERQAHKQTKAQLRALEDAIYNGLMPPEPGDDGTHVIISNFGEEGWTEINQAIANSRARKQQ